MKSIPSSKRLLMHVMNPQLQVAQDLLQLVKRRNSDDPTHRLQIAAVTILLAGVDKTLSLAIQLLFLAGRIDWGWMKPPKPRAGMLSCYPGLTAKIFKLKKLGLDVTELKELVDLRNQYIHSCSLSAGYSVGIAPAGKRRLTLRATGPAISYGGDYLLEISDADIRRLAIRLIDLVSKFVDRRGWRSAYISLARKIRRLPRDPQAELESIGNCNRESMSVIVDQLNQAHIGIGLSCLLEENAQTTTKVAPRSSRQARAPRDSV